MRHFRSFSSIHRFTRAGALILSLSAAACMSPHGTVGAEFDVRPDETAAYNECVAACSGTSSLALVTRTGCLDGCEQARRMFPLTNRTFSSRQQCLDALLDLDPARAGRVREMHQWCDAKWTHVHNRRGCYRAADIFYAALTPVSVCGSDPGESAAYDASPAKAKEEEVTAPALPGPEPTQEPDRTPPVPEQPATPALTDAASPDAAVLPPQPVEANAAPSNVTRSTQPAGPILPPPYTPGKTSGTEVPPPVSPPPPSEIHDTPKYQYAPAKAAPERVTTPSQQPTQPAASRQPSANAPSTKPPVPVAQPQATTPSSPVQANPAPVPAQAAPPSAEPLPAAQPEPAIPPVPETTPPAVPPAAPAPDATPGPVTAPPPAATPAPASERQPRQDQAPAAPRPDRAEPAVPVPPQPDPTVQRPIPVLPEAPPSEPDFAPMPPMMPPVPSMLYQPYTPPPILTPQVEEPPESPPSPQR